MHLRYIFGCIFLFHLFLSFTFLLFFFFFNDTATTEIYTLSLHDALPISREVRAEHRGPLDALHFVATLAIEFGQELAAARKLRRLRQIGLMAGSAGSLDEVRGQDRLLPGERGLVSFGDFRGRPLAAMTNRAAPLAHVVRNRRMRAQKPPDRLIRKARLRDSLMAGGAAVDHGHSGEPGLVN